MVVIGGTVRETVLIRCIIGLVSQTRERFMWMAQKSPLERAADERKLKKFGMPFSRVEPFLIP